jgi:hypothetical protein
MFIFQEAAMNKAKVRSEVQREIAGAGPIEDSKAVEEHMS